MVNQPWVPSQPLADSPPPYDTVVFDCDSTLSAMEGIEELVGDNPEIARLTAAAMDGRVPLEEVFKKRLELARPRREDMQRIGALYIEKSLPHARELVATLLRLGKRVLIVSGGLLPPVRQFGSWLGLGPTDIHAVDIFFDSAGHYRGFDEACPLARTGGKIEILTRIRSAQAAGPMAFVGDGATDIEAAHLAQRFIAFGGVERRAAVAQAALQHCDQADFAALAPLLLSPDEITQVTSDPATSAWLAPYA